ncbi:MAG TPA: hypothetical protein VKU87_01695, partial [Thermomicrobiaceae bacterium]|nr:hypothetical protein [Thermomicrobiaceae bacterium]
GLSGLLAAGGFFAPYRPSPNWTLVKVIAFSAGFLTVAALLFWKLLHTMGSETDFTGDDGWGDEDDGLRDLP